MKGCEDSEMSVIPNVSGASGDDVRGGQTHAEGLALGLHEANHRIRNLLAMIEAVMRQTQSESVEDFRTKVLTRISGFRAFHEVAGRSEGESISLADLLRQTMGVYCAKGGQVHASGPDVELAAGLALGLHLVFHELALNASKYGALNSPAGSVTVEWGLRAAGGADRKLAIVWTERGGPEVTYPQRRGFGSRVITRALEGYGKVQIDFRPMGVACYILIDLDRRAHHSDESVHSRPFNNS